MSLLKLCGEVVLGREAGNSSFTGSPFPLCPTASTPEESRENKKDKEGDKAAEENKQKAKGSKPLMPTSTILRLLAELVRSYVGIATLIANYNYTVGQSELIKEVRSPGRTKQT